MASTIVSRPAASLCVTRSQGVEESSRLRATSMSGRALVAKPVSFRAARTTTVTKASSDEKNIVQRAGAGLAALGLAATFAIAPMDVAMAGEFDIINTNPPQGGLVDDAGVLSKASQKQILKICQQLKNDTGFKLEVVTVRKLVFESDPFAFADQVIENWFPTVEEGNNVGVLLVSTTSKEGALVGGPAFMQAVGDDIVEGIVVDNIPIFTEQEKYNEALISSVNRISNRLNGKEDIPGPTRQEKAKGGNYKTKEDTAKNRNKFAGVVIGLLVIATAVPMIQYYGYTGSGK
mmetsp:Transcript_40084/g.76613  ORF Transcript_40084/g.76613 Transcript_40084/m.76613 type:complete len:291 (+) Transcript_40084:124-996(+)